MVIQPKPFLNNFKLRHKAYGVERRRNMSKLILNHAPNFPLHVEYKDIDMEFQKWVETELDISYNGRHIPTFRLFSNQRINEYAQNWQHLDESGNLLMNFKTITRDNNPKHGDNQGGSYNIPGNRDYPMFIVPKLDENGQQFYEMYSMKQPYCVDMYYTVTLITNKYELINEMNQLIHKKFQSIDCYIAPNQHFMPMTLENVSDESEYSIDDRKYYSQSYSIRIKAYIISDEDFKVTELPSRIVVRMLGDKKRTSKIEINKNSDDRYAYRNVVIKLNYEPCENKISFTSDSDFLIKEIQLNNVYDLVIMINEEKQDLENEINVLNGDKIEVRISKDDETTTSQVQLIGINPNIVVDSKTQPESSLDEPITDEIIEIT